MNAPTWLPEAIDEIAKLRALPHNWDSYGADPPSAENCLAALCLMRLLPEAGKPRIVPFDSGVQLEWGDVEIAFSGEITAIDEEDQDAEWAGLSAEYIKAAVAWLRKRLESLLPESQGMALECPRINDPRLIDRKAKRPKLDS